MASDETSALRFGNYEVLTRQDGTPHELGRGGFGRTFKAKHGFLGTEVALKVIHDRFAYDKAARGRFLKEAQEQARLNHPGIARITDFGEVEGTFYYAMELCEDGDLKELIKRTGPVAPHEALHLTLQVAEALHYAYAQGMTLHGDIKPGNLLVVFDARDIPQLKLIDFGLVQRAAQHGGEDESEGPAMWSPAFASPEQIREERLDWRSDFFSLGMTAWFLIAGGGPMDGTTADITRERLKDGSYLAQLPSTITDPLRSVLARLIEKNPNHRFASPNETLQAIRQALQGNPQLSGGWRTRQRSGASLKDRFHLEPSGRAFLGDTFRGVDRRSGLAVSVTIIRASHPATSVDQAIQRARTLMEKDSPGLHPVLEASEYTEGWAIVEQELPGALLADALKREGPLQIARAAGVLWEAATALDTLQTCGLTPSALDQALLENATVGQPVDWNTARFRLPTEYLAAPVEWSENTAQTINPEMMDHEATGPTKSFARLIYFMVGGRQVRTAALFSSSSYIAIPGLGATSNEYLSKCLAGESLPASCLSMLQLLFSHEGVPIEAAAKRAADASRQTFLHTVNREATRSAQALASAGDAWLAASAACRSATGKELLKPTESTWQKLEKTAQRAALLSEQAPGCAAAPARRALLTELRDLGTTAEDLSTTVSRLSREAQQLEQAATLAAQQLKALHARTQQQLHEVATTTSEIHRQATTLFQELTATTRKAPTAQALLPEATALHTRSQQAAKHCQQSLATITGNPPAPPDCEAALTAAGHAAQDQAEALRRLAYLQRESEHLLEAALQLTESREKAIRTIEEATQAAHDATSTALADILALAHLTTPRAERARRALARGQILLGNLDELRSEVAEADALTADEWDTVARESTSIQAQVLTALTEARSEAQTATQEEAQAATLAAAAAAAAAEAERNQIARLVAAADPLVNAAKANSATAFKEKMPVGEDTSELNKLQLRASSTAKETSALSQQLRTANTLNEATELLARIENAATLTRETLAECAALTQQAAEQAQAQLLAQRRQQAQHQQEQQQQREAEAKKEAEAKRLADAEVQRQAEAQRLAEAEAKRLIEAQSVAEAEGKRQAEAEAKRQAEAAAKRLAETEARRLADIQRQADAEAKRQADAHRLAEAEAQRQVKAEAKRQAEEQNAQQARVKAEALAQQKAEREAQEKAQAQKKLAEQLQLQQKKAEEKRQRDAQTAQAAEEKAHRDATARQLREAQAEEKRQALAAEKEHQAELLRQRLAEKLASKTAPTVAPLIEDPNTWTPAAPPLILAPPRGTAKKPSKAPLIVTLGLTSVGALTYFLWPSPKAESVSPPLPPTLTKTAPTSTPPPATIPTPRPAPPTPPVAQKPPIPVEPAKPAEPPVKPAAPLTCTLTHDLRAASIYKTLHLTNSQGEKLSFPISSGPKTTLSLPPGAYTPDLHLAENFVIEAGTPTTLTITAQTTALAFPLPVPPEHLTGLMPLTGTSTSSADDAIALNSRTALNIRFNENRDTAIKKLATSKTPTKLDIPFLSSPDAAPLRSDFKLPIIVGLAPTGLYLSAPSYQRTLDAILLLASGLSGLENAAVLTNNSEIRTPLNTIRLQTTGTAADLALTSKTVAQLYSMLQKASEAKGSKGNADAAQKLVQRFQDHSDYCQNYFQDYTLPTGAHSFAKVSNSEPIKINLKTGSFTAHLPPAAFGPGLEEASLTLTAQADSWLATLELMTPEGTETLRSSPLSLTPTRPNILPP